MQDTRNILTIVLVGCTLFLCMVSFVVLFLLLYTRRHQRHIKEKELLTAQFTETLLQSQIEIQEQTLSYISRELHDNLSHVAALIKINLNTIDPSGAASKLEASIQNSKELTKQLINDLKMLSVKLSSDKVIHVGLVAALETEPKQLNNTGVFTVHLVMVGKMPEIDKDRALILYRMVQEIINNIVKHSIATEINILLSCSVEGILLRISDNGVGFDAKAQMPGDGAGLFNLQHRSKLIGASVDFESEKGKGTIVTIRL